MKGYSQSSLGSVSVPANLRQMYERVRRAPFLWNNGFSEETTAEDMSERRQDFQKLMQAGGCTFLKSKLCASFFGLRAFSWAALKGFEVWPSPSPDALGGPGLDASAWLRGLARAGV